MDSSTVKQEEKSSQEKEKTLREIMEFDLYSRANRFVKEKIVSEEEGKMVSKGPQYRISKTRLENLSRAFRISYPAFNKLINNYITRLEREVIEASYIRAATAKRESEILKEIRTQCSPAIVEEDRLGFKETASRAERKVQAQQKEEYAGRLAHAWFTHFVSAYVYKVNLKEK